MKASPRLTRRSFLVGLGASAAVYVAGCAQAPAASAPRAPPRRPQDSGTRPPTAATRPPRPTTAAAAAPRRAEERCRPEGHASCTVGGDTEVLEPTNFNPYSLGGLGRIRGSLNKTFMEFLYYYNHNDGQEIPWLAESYKVVRRRHEGRRHAAQGRGLVRRPALHLGRRQVHPGKAPRHAGAGLPRGHEGVGQGRRRSRTTSTLRST